jgi:nicotinate-nucleotide adenylyltransferase
MRVGLYGGTFDPVHFGHLVLAEQCREQLSLDSVWFIPAGTPPHKAGREISPGPSRAEMLECAIAGTPQFRVHPLELQRTGPSYTVDTLRQLRQEHPGDSFFLLLGADMLADLPNWREPGAVATLATLVAVNRGGEAPPNLAMLKQSLGEVVNSVLRVSMPEIAISSRDLRTRVRERRSIRYLTPRAVEAYIEQHGLYRAGSGTPDGTPAT